jgi:virginiamycin B lyase
MATRALTLLIGAVIWLLGPATAMAQSAGLPQGAGRDIVEATCSACHRLSVIERSSGYDQAGWQELILTMIDLSDSTGLETISAYLARHFPENDSRAPNLVSGAHKIRFTEWVTPTPGQRTRDPVEAPDGSIWWAGQWADLVGRIDPASGEAREFPLPSGARPHTVTADAQGNIWYTGNGNATMGKLDPATGQVTRPSHARPVSCRDSGQPQHARAVGPSRSAFITGGNCRHETHDRQGLQPRTARAV